MSKQAKWLDGSDLTFDEYWQSYGDELNDMLDAEERAKLIWEDSRRTMKSPKTPSPN